MTHNDRAQANLNATTWRGSQSPVSLLLATPAGCSRCDRKSCSPAASASKIYGPGGRTHATAKTFSERAKQSTRRYQPCTPSRTPSVGKAMPPCRSFSHFEGSMRTDNRTAKNEPPHVTARALQTPEACRPCHTSAALNPTYIPSVQCRKTAELLLSCPHDHLPHQPARNTNRAPGNTKRPHTQHLPRNHPHLFHLLACARAQLSFPTPPPYPCHLLLPPWFPPQIPWQLPPASAQRFTT